MKPAKIAPMRDLVSLFIIRLPTQPMRGQDELTDFMTLLHFYFTAPLDIVTTQMVTL